MSRAVYISGFMGGGKATERVASVLRTNYYDEVESFTFSDAMQNPERIRDILGGATVVTHSAGMLATAGMQPEELHSFGPPLPQHLRHLLVKTPLKRKRMHEPGVGIQSPQDEAAIKAYEASSATELLTHPFGNFRWLGKILPFDAVDVAITAQKRGVKTHLIYTAGDEYFQLSDERETRARQAGVGIMRLAGGIHDELPLRPEATLRAFYEKMLAI